MQVGRRLQFLTAIPHRCRSSSVIKGLQIHACTRKPEQPWQSNLLWFHRSGRKGQPHTCFTAKTELRLGPEGMATPALHRLQSGSSLLCCAGPQRSGCVDRRSPQLPGECPCHSVAGLQGSSPVDLADSGSKIFSNLHHVDNDRQIECRRSMRCGDHALPWRPLEVICSERSSDLASVPSRPRLAHTPEDGGRMRRFTERPKCLFRRSRVTFPCYQHRAK